MPEIFRTRDLIVFTKGAAYPVATSDAMIQAGWPGGQGLSWVDSSRDEFMVGLTDGGRGAGFALWGSDEDADKLTSITEYQPAYGFVIKCSGSWLISTSTFEVYTWASRNAGPLVEISYSVTDKLYWSLRGYFTSEDEWTASGDPRAPNTDPVGYVVQVPSSVTENYLTVQTIL